VPQSCRGQHQCRLPIREGAHYLGSSLDLPDDPLQRVVGLDVTPVLSGEEEVTQRLVNTLTDRLRCGGEPPLLQLLDDAPGLLHGFLVVLLGVDCLEHRRDLFHLAARSDGEDVSVKVDHGTVEKGVSSTIHDLFLIQSDDYNPNLL